MGESKGAEVSRKTGQEGQTQNECSSESENCSGSQGALEAGQSSRQKHPVNQRVKDRSDEEMISGQPWWLAAFVPHSRFTSQARHGWYVLQSYSAGGGLDLPRGHDEQFAELDAHN